MWVRSGPDLIYVRPILPGSGSRPPRRSLAIGVASPGAIGQVGLIAFIGLIAFLDRSRMRVGAGRGLFLIERADLPLHAAARRAALGRGGKVIGLVDDIIIGMWIAGGVHGMSPLVGKRLGAEWGCGEGGRHMNQHPQASHAPNMDGPDARQSGSP